MDTNNLFCLHRCANGMWLEVAKISELFEKNQEAKSALEFNQEKTQWRYITPGGVTQSKSWTDIGKNNSSDDKFIQFVFDPTDFNQLKRAFTTASHYYSSRD